MRCAKELHFLNYCSHKMNKFLTQNMLRVSFPISILSRQAAVKKVMFTCPGLNLVQSIFSCLSAQTNPDVYLPWA